MMKRMVMVWMIMLAGLCGTVLPGFCEEAATEPSTGVAADEAEKLPGADAPAQAAVKNPEKQTAAASAGPADSPASETDARFNSTEALIELMKEKGLISEEEADAFLEEYQKAKAEGAVITVIPGRGKGESLGEITEKLSKDLQKEVEAVRENLDDTTQDLYQRAREAKSHRDLLEVELREDVKDQLRKSEWSQRFRWGGDLRLRYQADYFDEENAEFGKPEDPSEIMNTRNDRHRGRIRVRLKAKATVFKPQQINTGKMEAGVRITTGSVDDPVSTNETLGDYNNKDSIVLDRAYLKWAYKPETTIWGQIPELSLQGGRFGSPYLNTDLIWDSDLMFEGGALSFKTDTQDEFNPWAGFFTIGGYLLQEEELFQQDKWFYGAQAGLTYEEPFGVNAALGIALYDFRHTGGVVNDPTRPGIYDWTAPQYLQKGNTLIDINPNPGVTNMKMALAADYKEMVITGKLDYGYSYPNHVILTGEYVENIGFDVGDVARRTGLDPSEVKEDTEGYRIGLSIGNPKVRWFQEWQVYTYYKHLESDAVLDAFTDSDFHLGGTNAKGWVFGVDLGIHKNVWMTTRWITTDEISGPPLAVDTLQVNLNAEF
ncbi:MAG: putative porin [Thermodesulfobacteriota bacterium]|nr:putative porin [Thermodesulfobacteriota bacterium]